MIITMSKDNPDDDLFIKFTLPNNDFIMFNATELTDSPEFFKIEFKSDKVFQEWLTNRIDKPNTDPDNVQTVGTGQLVFHNKSSSSAIIPKIHKQLELCENENENKDFRIDWKIISCSHEWDGILLNRPYAGNLGLCKHCGEECYVGITYEETKFGISEGFQDLKR